MEAIERLKKIHLTPAVLTQPDHKDKQSFVMYLERDLYLIKVDENKVVMLSFPSHMFSQVLMLWETVSVGSCCHPLPPPPSHGL